MSKYFGPIGGIVFILCLISVITGDNSYLLFSLIASLIFIFYYDTSIKNKKQALSNVFYIGIFILIIFPFLLFLIIPGYYIYAIANYMGNK